MNPDLLERALIEVEANRTAFSEDVHKQLMQMLLDAIHAAHMEQSEAVTGEDEMRVVTVMFIDIQDSIKLAQRLETEDFKALIGGVHALIGKMVTGWEGEIGQYLGDGLLCFFGAHHSRGDEASRAVSCALAIQRAMQDAALDVFKQDLSLRIAISTGRVVVGLIGGQQKKEFLAIGSATNLAARLQTICPAGSVYIDAPTFYRIQEEFDTEAKTPAPLKGYEQPVEHYVVLRRRPPRQHRSGTHIAGIELPFVGREHELSCIKTLETTVQTTGQFQVGKIFSEAGIGKSALLRRAIADIDTGHFRVATLIMDYEKRTLPYNLLRTFLATACNLSDDTPQNIAENRIQTFFRETWKHSQADITAAVIGYIAGYGYDQHPSVVALKRSSRAIDRIIGVWLARWFTAFLLEKPFVLVIDNIQWLDDRSLTLLRHLIKTCGQRAWLLLLVGRTKFREHCAKFISTHSEILLTHLNGEASAQLVNAALAHVDELPDGFGSTIIERTGGNPLYIEEFLRMLFGSGVFEAAPTESAPQRHKFNRRQYNNITLSLPGGLQGVLQARLDDLPATSRLVVQIAAVIGHRFWGEAVSVLAGFDAHPALKDLATRSIIVSHTEKSPEQLREYAFRHTLHREAAYSMLARSTRERYHREIAAWLSERMAGKPEYLPVMARHFGRGKQPEQSLIAYLKAADDLLQHGFMNDVLKITADAQASLDELPDEAKAVYTGKVLLVRGLAFNALHRYEEATLASKGVLRMLEGKPKHEYAREHSEAARILGTAYRSLGRYDEATIALNLAHKLLPENSPQMGAVLQSIGALYRYRGQLEESLTYLHRALDIADKNGDERLKGGTLTQIGFIAYERGQMLTALSYFERALEINRLYENLYYQAYDLRNIGMVHDSSFAHDKAFETYNRAAELHAQLHNEDLLLYSYRGLCLISLKQPEEGLQLIQKGAQAELQDIFAQQTARLALLQGLALTGCYAECHDLAKDFVETTRNLNPILYARGLLVLGIMQYRLENHVAEETLKLALENEQIYGGRDLWRCYYALSEVCNDPRTGRTYLTQAVKALKDSLSGLWSHPDVEGFLKHSIYPGSVFYQR